MHRSTFREHDVSYVHGNGSLPDDPRSLLDSLDALIRHADGGEGLTGDLRDRLQHWLAHVRRHEESENEFFAEVIDEAPC